MSRFAPNISSSTPASSSPAARRGGVKSRASSDAPRAPVDLMRQQAPGLLAGDKSGRISGRVTPKLLAVAKAKSGIASDSELLEYALLKVALEDDYGRRLLARKGSVAADVDL